MKYTTVIWIPGADRDIDVIISAIVTVDEYKRFDLYNLESSHELNEDQKEEARQKLIDYARAYPWAGEAV